MTKNLLFEVGTEDLPPKDLPGLAEGFEKSLVSKFEDNYLSFSGVELYYTTRRLGVQVGDVPETQNDRTKSIRGPAKKVGIDEGGDFTEAAFGFAKSNSADVDDLYVEEDEDGTYLYLDKHIEGEPTEEVLQRVLPEIVGDLPQPEKMRWDSSGLEFLRPVRWVVCLFGEEVVEFEVGSLETGRVTSGHRFLGGDAIELDSPDQYQDLLADNSVIVSPEERSEEVRRQLDREAEQVNGTSASSEEFLQIISNSLEHPTAILGELPSRFLDLPKVLLYKTLEGEARLIPLQDEDWSPIPYFVGFRDGEDDSEGVVRAGYESVINARLRDSEFFFEKDRERGLEEYVSDLKTVTYQESLGSIWDKVERMRNIAHILIDELELGYADEIDRTIFLSKADLVTAVVDEFPSLQGHIGSIYAEMDGEKELVATGIREHYLPEASDDPLPESLTGIVASLVDKVDSLLGSFLLGEEPTGTSDPYGLRRKANAVVRIVIEEQLDFDLFVLLDSSVDLYQFLETEVSPSRLKEYLADRLERVLRSYYEFSYDVVQSVIVLHPSNFYDAYCKASALEELKGSSELEQVVNTFTRIVNIGSGNRDKSYDPELFQLEIEKKLWREYLKIEGRVDELVEGKEYGKAVQALLGLKNSIDEYFDHVMVMAEDSEIRENRLRFLGALHDLYTRVADFTEIVHQQ